MKNFMPELLLYFCLFMIISCSSDNPTKDVTEEIFWNKSDSPILIEGCYVIPVNTTLNVEAGTEIRFRSKLKKDDPYSEIKTGMLVVQGKIIAEGTQEDSIIFTKDESTDNWGAIVFEATADPNSILKYCKIQYSSEVSDYQYRILGAIAFLAYSKANVINCNITKNDYGIQCNGYAAPVINECAISYNKTGIYSYKCRSLVNNCLIYSNSDTGIYGYGSYATISGCEIRDNVTGSGIFVEYNSYPEIINNTIKNNGYSGINCYEESSPNIIYNIIENNTENGILSNYHCQPNIVNNLVKGSIRGIHLANYSDPVIINNTVTNNDYAYMSYNECSPYIINSIIWNNGSGFDIQDYYYNTVSNPVLLSSLLQDDSLHHSVIDGGGNILGSDPLFVNDSIDFNLQSSSPCINSGFSDITELPKLDLSGNPRIFGSSIDIGAYEYQGVR
ncbi:MAG TPA: right-handed parallel beta-helix repeat-containing protein [Clostridiales bacterium]|nr:right-handed parallel beta-helix repeat-containing protein [Clostridiales bacterium]HQP70658.1 right-handed parallel beta-helix repeat-containing protein [Clostridiales bacterium]